MQARAHRERQWEPRGNGTGTEQQREPAGLCSHTHAESEREREVNGSTPPHGMAAASHVPSLLSAMRVHTERDSGSRGETGRVQKSRESLRASAATHTQRVREREVNGSTPPRGMAAASHVPSLLSAMHARAHCERQWEPRGNGTGTEQQREPARLCSHTNAEREREREVNGSTPPRGMAAASHVPSLLSAMRVHTERDSGSRGETGPVRSSRESLRASAATHTQRVREREVNGSTPPHGMAAASHVPSLLSATRVHTERDSGSREETGPVRSSRESLRASAATHAQRERERERGEWQHASSWDGSRITCLLSPLCHARAH